jgi:hypothetical protein
MTKAKDYGKITTGYGTATPKEHSVIEFVQATYNDNRKITVSKLEDDSLFLTIENPKDSGREPKSMLRLSKESLVGLLTTCLMYSNSVGWDLKELLENQMNGETVGYSHSDNITIKL